MDGDTQFGEVEERLAAEALIVDVDGFEGPLDLLLVLSRTQKVDLLKISVLALAEQYLEFVERAKTRRRRPIGRRTCCASGVSA